MSGSLRAGGVSACRARGSAVASRTGRVFGAYTSEADRPTAPSPAQSESTHKHTGIKLGLGDMT